MGKYLLKLIMGKLKDFYNQFEEMTIPGSSESVPSMDEIDRKISENPIPLALLRDLGAL